MNYGFAVSRDYLRAQPAALTRICNVIGELNPRTDRVIVRHGHEVQDEICAALATERGHLQPQRVHHDGQLTELNAAFVAEVDALFTFTAPGDISLVPLEQAAAAAGKPVTAKG